MMIWVAADVHAFFHAEDRYLMIVHQAGHAVGNNNRLRFPIHAAILSAAVASTGVSTVFRRRKNTCSDLSRDLKMDLFHRAQIASSKSSRPEAESPQSAV